MLSPHMSINILKRNMMFFSSSRSKWNRNRQGCKGWQLLYQKQRHWEQVSACNCLFDSRNCLLHLWYQASTINWIGQKGPLQIIGSSGHYFTPAKSVSTPCLQIHRVYPSHRPKTQSTPVFQIFMRLLLGWLRTKFSWPCPPTPGGSNAHSFRIWEHCSAGTKSPTYIQFHQHSTALK